MNSRMNIVCSRITGTAAVALMPFMLLPNGASAAAVSADAGASAAGAPALPKIKIVLVGDSTVAPRTGWGPAFAALMGPNAAVSDLAQGGRSSKSYINEGHWKRVLEQKADYVLIQFGHNDVPGKGLERETDPATTYPQYMARYVDEARAAGAKPILITSVTRRNFKNGKINDALAPYAEAVKKLAAKQNVPLVDLHARSIEQLNAIGPQAAVEYDAASDDPAKPDRTHFSAKGAAATAQLVAEELKQVVPELRPYFLESENSAAPSSAKADAVVAADGSGDFKTMQEAIAAVPDNRAERTVIHIKPGTYQGQIILPKEKNNVTFQGEDVEKTVLTFSYNTNEENPPSVNQSFKGTGVVILGDDFRAENITFQNASGDHGQALALRIDGDRAELHNCRLFGWQDTLMVNNGRQYFRNCYVEGRVDFIYGSGTVIFDRCQIHSKNGGHVTAASTPQEKPYGLVFLNCVLTGDPYPWVDPATGQFKSDRRFGAAADLGRPWRPYANVAYINCKMGDHVMPAGWNNWGKPDNEKTARYAEYNSQTLAGKPLDVSSRVPWSKQLTAEQAAPYTIPKILGGVDNWNPTFAGVASSEEPLPLLPTVALHLAGSTPAATTPATSPPAVTTPPITDLTAPAITTPTTSPPVRGKVRIVLAGDSTVTDDAGWGAGFKQHLKPEVELINLSKGGRSSGSFVAEGRWKQTLELKPDYVLIQFGHNDQPGHGPERETDPKTTYRVNMERYVDEAKAAGITPILVTSLSRRQWGADGKIHSTLTPYAETVKQIAAEKNVPLIDLHALSIALYEKMGKDAVLEISPRKNADPNSKNSDTAATQNQGYDGTHLNAKGGPIVGRLVADALRQAVPALAPYLKAATPS